MNHICVAFHPHDAGFAAEVAEAISHHLHLEVQLIGQPPDGEQNWIERLDRAIQETLALVVILTPEALTARHVTFGWLAAQQMRKPVISLRFKPLPDQLSFDSVQHVSFLDDDPWEEVIRRVWDSALGTLLMRLWNPDRAVRLAAVEALGDLGDSRAVWPLTERLRDEDQAVRIAALAVLTELQDERCVPILLTLLRDEDEAVARAAQDALRTFPPEKTGLDVE